MIGYNRKSLKLIDFESSKQLENSQATQMRFVGRYLVYHDITFL